MTSQNRQKYTDFIKTEYSRLLNFVRARVNDSAAADSEDILNDALAGIFERADISAPVENVAAYIYRAIRNRIIDSFRKGSGEPDRMELTHVQDDTRYSPEYLFQSEEIHRGISDALSNLPEELSSVFIMNEVDCMTFREIAERTGLPPGTLMARKAKAVKILRNRISKFINVEE